MVGPSYIVRISEETNTGDDTSTNMVPAKGSFVDLGERKTTTLIGILNVGEIIVEVVEGIVASTGLVGRDNGRLRRHCKECFATRETKEESGIECWGSLCSIGGWEKRVLMSGLLGREGHAEWEVQHSYIRVRVEINGGVAYR